MCVCMHAYVSCVCDTHTHTHTHARTHARTHAHTHTHTHTHTHPPNTYMHAVGRYCEYRVKDIDRSLEFDTFEEYKEETLELVCDPSTTEGSPGMFQWTPDNDTPDTIYYQVHNLTDDLLLLQIMI